MTHHLTRSYRDLHTWQRAMELAEACYRVVAELPADERHGLGLQIRRAAVSIPSNIAEGHNGGLRHVLLTHLAMALGSQGELETQLELVQRLFKTDVTAVRALSIEVGKLLHGLVTTLERSETPRPTREHGARHQPDQVGALIPSH